MKVMVKGYRFLTVLAACLFCTAGYAQTAFEQANAAYAEGRYAEAATLYSELIDQQGLDSRSMATLYYNLGNAQFKQGELAQSILAYERALRMQPSHREARHNLRFAQSRITDNIPEQDFFVSTWARAVRNSLSEPTWWMVSVGLWLLTLCAIILFLLGRTTWLRKTAFHIAWLALLFALIAGCNAYSLNRRDALRAEAVITQGVVNAKASPDRSGTDLFTLHEGTKVTIRETIGEWANVRVGNYEGWVRLQNLERI